MRAKFLQWDLLGISVSVLCVLHCVALPLFFSSVSIWGGTLLHNAWLEAATLFLSFVIGAIAFYKGCFVQHKGRLPLLLFTVGFAFLLLNYRDEKYALYLVPAAALLMITAHLLNYHKCKNYCRLLPQAKTNEQKSSK